MTIHACIQRAVHQVTPVTRYTGCWWYQVPGTGTRYMQGLQSYGKGQGLVHEVLFKRDLLTYIKSERMAIKGFMMKDKVKIIEATVSVGEHRHLCGCAYSDDFSQDVDLSWRVGLSPAADKLLEFIDLYSIFMSILKSL